MRGYRNCTSDAPILVTGAAGRVGGVGGAVVDILRQRDLPVRTLVGRDGDRANALWGDKASVCCRNLHFG